MSKRDEKKKSKKEFWSAYYKNTRHISAIRMIISMMISFGCLIATIIITIDPYKRESQFALIIILTIIFIAFLIIGISNLYVLIKHRSKD